MTSLAAPHGGPCVPVVTVYVADIVPADEVFVTWL
jgi:hypothetical protein